MNYTRSFPKFHDLIRAILYVEKEILRDRGHKEDFREFITVLKTFERVVSVVYLDAEFDYSSDNLGYPESDFKEMRIQSYCTVIFITKVVDPNGLILYKSYRFKYLNSDTPRQDLTPTPGTIYEYEWKFLRKFAYGRRVIYFSE